MPIPDQTFRLTKASFVAELVKCEDKIAGFTNDTMTELGQGRTLRGGPGAGSGEAIGFPHGQVDMKRRQFRPAANPTLAVEDQVTPDYPTSLAAAGEVAIVEASGPLLLAQAAALGDIAGIYRVSSDQHLIVFGDVVTIRGKVRLYGKHVMIFARVLRTVADEHDQRRCWTRAQKILSQQAGARSPLPGQARTVPMGEHSAAGSGWMMVGS
jgi:hypothetical protein